MGGSYRRALVLLRATNLIENTSEGRLLAAQCLQQIGDHQECLAVLGGWNDADVQMGKDVRPLCRHGRRDKCSIQDACWQRSACSRSATTRNAWRWAAGTTLKRTWAGVVSLVL